MNLRIGLRLGTEYCSKINEMNLFSATGFNVVKFQAEVRDGESAARKKSLFFLVPNYMMFKSLTTTLSSLPS